MKTQIAFLLFALLVGVSGEALQNVKAQDNADIQAAKVSDAWAALDSGNESGEDALDSGDHDGEDELDSAEDAEDDEDALMAADPEPGRGRCNRFGHSKSAAARRWRASCLRRSGGRARRRVNRHRRGRCNRFRYCKSFACRRWTASCLRRSRG